MSEKLWQVLQRRRTEIAKERGYLSTEALTWQDIADNINVPRNNLLRWKDENGGVPSTFEYVYKLAEFFGPDVYTALGIDISEDLAYLMGHRSDPNVAEIIRQARQKAQGNRGNSYVPARL